MTKAMFGVALTSLFLMFFLWLTENMAKQSLTDDVVIESPPDAHTFAGSNNPTTGDRNAKTLTNHGFLFLYNHEGFGGFNGYNIVKDPTILSSIPDNSIRELVSKNPDPGFGAAYDPESEQYAFGYGDEDSDFGIPGGLSLIDIASHLFPYTDFPIKEIDIPRPDEPAFIKLTKKPRHPSNAYMISGVVVVEFIIRKNGAVTDRKLLSEEPEGYNFADSVLEALNEAHYWPAKLKGEKTDTKITFTWTMCSGSDCKGSNTSYSEQLIIEEDFPKQEKRIPSQAGYLWK